MKARIIVNTHQPERAELTSGQQGMIWDLEKLVERMRQVGLVVTIETVPHRPRCMGSYDTHIDVRKARELAEPIERAVAPGGTILTVRNTISDHAIDFSQRNADKPYPL